MVTQTTLDGLIELNDALRRTIGKNDIHHYIAVINYDNNHVDREARKIAGRILKEQFDKNPETYYRSTLVTNALEAEILLARKEIDAR